MLQIKTIYTIIPAEFDAQVNEALADGWTLNSRYMTATDHFVAELSMDVITEVEKCCENCEHFDKDFTQEPCCNCSDNADKWEAFKV